jgi:hypothetical protein
LRALPAPGCQGCRCFLLPCTERGHVSQDQLQLAHQKVDGEDERDRGRAVTSRSTGVGAPCATPQPRVRGGSGLETARRTDSEATTMKPSTTGATARPAWRAGACRASDMAKPASASPLTPAVAARWMRRRPVSAGSRRGRQRTRGRPRGGHRNATPDPGRPLRSRNDERHHRRSDAVSAVPPPGGIGLAVRRHRFESDRRHHIGAQVREMLIYRTCTFP